MTNDPTFSEKITEEAAASERPEKKRRPKRGSQPAQISYPDKKVLVQGERNVLYNIAQCCHPHYPDLIMGYVTRSKGVSIHKADCIIYQRIPNKEERSVEVSWEK